MNGMKRALLNGLSAVTYGGTDSVQLTLQSNRVVPLWRTTPRDGCAQPVLRTPIPRLALVVGAVVAVEHRGVHVPRRHTKQKVVAAGEV